MKEVSAKYNTWWILLSPTAAVVWSIAVAVVSIFFPRELYEQLMLETNYIQYSMLAALYVTLCIAAFAIGFSFHKWLVSAFARRKVTRWKAVHERNPPLPLVIAVSAVLILVSVYVLVSIFNAISSAVIINSLLGEESSLVLRANAAEVIDEQNIGFLFGASIASVPWLTWITLRILASHQRASLEGSLAIALISVVLLLILVNAVLSNNRSELLYPLFAAFVVWAAFRMKQGRLKPRRLVFIGLAVFVFALVYFSLTAITRLGVSGDAARIVGETFVGYFVSPYNRVAAILNGTLVLPGRGGFYWAQWFWKMPVVGNSDYLISATINTFGAIPPISWLDFKPYIDGAGLNPSMNIFTVFGYAYIDFGWLGFMPFIVYGFCSRISWIAFQHGRVWAIILYPYVLWSIVEWRGYIEITRASLDVFILVAAAVSMGELLIRSYARPRPRIRGGANDQFGRAR